ncbi:Aromatic-amino-acid aminotransferase [Achromobacter aegrifaciens]|uniref:amino acid aminotransferase n=1 Tax=Achromobacter aegrifaciens TaxID=1287736 RepID=UPI0014659CEE|nr:amino acid aminotransferase [Achromobacter aegrifaciens]CAB3813404.1 Aromatic-amino-acid aminotransferase [Achromobacter aegrifaciens]
MQSLFSPLPATAGDTIFALVEAFQNDPAPHKVSLSIGTYFAEDGSIPVMRAVRQARDMLVQAGKPHPYLPIPGSASYRNAARSLIFGANGPEPERVVTTQSVGGTGALKLGADLLRHICPKTTVWVSDPTWENHAQIFRQAGFAVHEYPYYDAQTATVRFAQMHDALQALPAGSIVVLHASCHNPTGVDLSADQWEALTELFARQGLIPFFDLAYQGFGLGLDADAEPIRAMARAGVECLVASSFSKNFSLYGERCGALNIVCRDQTAADRALGQLKLLIRGNYSTPPTFGAALVAAILSDDALRQVWTDELEQMRTRLVSLRARLSNALTQLTGAREAWDYIERQQGLFSYMRLSPQQVESLRREHAVYLLKSGRLCVAGLTDGNIDYVARAIAACTQR